MTDEPSTPVLDLNMRLWQRTRGDITIIGTWILTTRRPCLALTPSRTIPTHDRVTPCIVPLDMAFAWDEHTGDPADAAAMSFQFAAALGLNPMEPRNVFAVTSLIRDSLGDLLAMPPFPEGEKQAVADVRITDPETGKTTEAEIVDNV